MALSRIFRYAIKGHNIVTVEEEIANIREYAKIIFYRFGGRIQVGIEVEEEAKKRNMLKLIIQPVVENSIIHAFEDDRRGIIEISSEFREGGMCFMIRDNGKGMDENAWKNPIDGAMKSKGKFNKIGLTNVDERLKMIYGKNYGISVSSTIGKGTIVTLHFPNPVLRGNNESTDC